MMLVLAASVCMRLRMCLLLMMLLMVLLLILSLLEVILLHVSERSLYLILVALLSFLNFAILFVEFQCLCHNNSHLNNVS